MRPSRLNHSPIGFALPSLNRSMTIISMHARVADPGIVATDGRRGHKPITGRLDRLCAGK
jgi:hypothetical protein